MAEARRQMFTDARASLLVDATDCMRRALARGSMDDELRKTFRITRRGGNHISTIMGSAMHKYVQYGDAAKWREYLEESWLKRAPIDFDDITPKVSVARRQLDAMAKAFDSRFPDWREGALMIEAELSLDITVDDVRLTLNGHPDMVGADGAIYDLKTGRRKNAPNHAAQLGAYAILVNNCTDVKPTGIRVVSLSRADQSIVVYDYPLAESVRLAQGAIRNMVKARDSMDQFEKDGDEKALIKALAITAPSNPSSHVCTPKWCEAFGSRFCPVTQMTSKEVT